MSSAKPLDLDRLARLTRDYADYGGQKAGLVGLFGTVLLALPTGFGTGWTLAQALAERTGSGPWPGLLQSLRTQAHLLPGWITALVWAAPFLFILGSTPIRRWAYQPLGPVRPRKPDLPRSPRTGLLLLGALAALMATFALGDAFGWFRGQESQALRLFGEILLGAAFVWLMRARRPQGDEWALALLLWGSAGLAAASPAGWWAFAAWFFLGLSFIPLIRSAIQHAAFLKLKRELASLQTLDAL